MKSLRAFFFRFSSLFHRSARDSDLSAELDSHLQLHIDENLARGMDPAEARRHALIKLGGLAQTTEHYRARRGLPFLETLAQDLRYAARMLAKSPGFTAVAILTLALGIGATTAIFSVIKATILNPLPFRQPSSLVNIWGGSPGERYHLGDQSYFSSVHPGDFYAWRAQSRSLETASAYRWQSMLLTGEKQAELVDAQTVADQFFETLGTPAQLGRTFGPKDYGPSAPHVAVISHRMWVEVFGKDPGIIGRRIRLDHESYEVLGVMPSGFYPTRYEFPELWVPHWASVRERDDLTSWGWAVVARLKQGVTWEQAQTELDVVTARLAKARPLDQGTGAVVVPTVSEIVGTSWKLLYLLFGAVALLFLIALVNVTNLLLARAIRRQREFSIRAALGAGRARLIAQLFTESLLLALLAGIAGIAIASAGTRALLALLPSSALDVVAQQAALPRLDTVKVDLGVLGFVFAIVLVASLVFGMIPLFHLSQNQAANSLKADGWGSSLGRHKRRLGHAFVVSQFSFSLVLLIIGALLVDGFIKVERTNPGFEPRNLLTFQLDVPQMNYGKIVAGGDNSRRERGYQQIEQRLASVPGVESVAFAAKIPLRQEFNPWTIRIEGRKPGNDKATDSGTPGFGGHGEVSLQRVSPSFYETLKLELLSGRLPDENDNANAPMIAVVNQAFVRTFFPSEDPIGKHITVDGTDWFPRATIIGVIADLRLNALDRKPYPTVFWSLRQVPTESDMVSVLVRTRSNPLPLSAAVRQAVRNFDPELPITGIESMTAVVSDSLWRSRISASLIGLLAILAIGLAGTGIYSVMSYSVSQRTHEMGIRMALGANPRDVLRLILRETCLLASFGSLLGCVAAFAAGRIAMNQVYLAPSVATSQDQTMSLHPAAFIISSLFLFGVAVSACYIPARRAMRVDPMVALRYE
ncbi:MAG TPA: ABC transporter permease [Candidatus Acidoferrales bacterium]|nr:ABC transporter permease [Candidatus Acidoferrales bacterium]